MASEVFSPLVHLSTPPSEHEYVCSLNESRSDLFDVPVLNPPKKKGSGKKSAKPKTPTLIYGLTKEEISKEQIEEHILRLGEELDREREERNYFQLERDKIDTFWEITNRKHDEMIAELKVLDKAGEDDEGRHKVEIQVYKQKMKHLLCEHQNTLSELKAYCLETTEVLQMEQEQLEMELYKKRKSLLIDMQELDDGDLISELTLKHDEEMTVTKNNWERLLEETTGKYVKKMQQLEQELEDLNKSVISECTLLWNTHISAIIEDHKKFTRENLSVLFKENKKENKEELKKNIAEQRGKVTKILQQQRFASRKTKSLADVVSKTQSDSERKVNLISERKGGLERDKTKALRDVKRDYEELEEIFRELQLERDDLHKSFTMNVESYRGKADEGNVGLERKLQALRDSLDTTEAQLQSVLTATNMDHTALSEFTQKVEENLESIKSTMKNLEYKGILISKVRRDVQLAAEAKQRTFCYSSEEPSP
ncbi:dynein regulatory complex subunit 4-like [Menidia menidia]